MIRNLENSEEKNIAAPKQEVLGIFSFERGGGSPIPKSICQNSDQKVNILMKTKNAPKDLKRKINHIFFGNMGSQKGGGGGGVRHLGKIPKNPVFLDGFPNLTLKVTNHEQNF